MFLFFRTLKAVIGYAKIDSVKIAEKENKSKNSIFIDMIFSYILFRAYTNDYIKYKLYNKNIFCRFKEYKKWDLLGIKMAIVHKRQKQIRKMLNKYGSKNYRNAKERNKKYRKMFNMGEKCYIQHNVEILAVHGQLGEIKIGNTVLIARNVDIDFTGGLEIKDRVSILEGAKILTHGHDYFGMREDLVPFTNRVYFTKLVIEEDSVIGARAIIMPSVNKIGKNSFVSAGSVVTTEVPENVIVAGNPAVVITKFNPKRRKPVRDVE